MATAPGRLSIIALVRELSPKTLGRVRDALYALDPEGEHSSAERQEFWKKTLFDAGLAPAFIDVAATYQFNWTDIIPHLHTGKFGAQNQTFATRIPPNVGELYLNRLVAFALEQSKDTLMEGGIRESLQDDGFAISSESQTNIPPELAKLPTKEALLKDLSSQIRDHSLVAVMFVDLDNFKSVNDQLGHSEGDKCLIDVVTTIRGVVQGKGKLYRCGGDEFCVLLPNFSTAEAHVTAERIRAAIEAMPPVGGIVEVTTSIGVASSDVPYLENPQALVDSADGAMYVSKWTTKNRVCAWPPSNEDKELAQKNRANAAAKGGR